MWQNCDMRSRIVHWRKRKLRHQNRRGLAQCHLGTSVSSVASLQRRRWTFFGVVDLCVACGSAISLNAVDDLSKKVVKIRCFDRRTQWYLYQSNN